MSATAHPVDVRLMNATAAALVVVGIALLAGAAVLWALRHPAFALDAIAVQGETGHNSVATLRANVAPRLAGNFFTIDLAQARRVFESVPWVRRAEVRRQFPNRLRVTLQEHHPVAYWGAENESRMVNGFGEVFEANVGDVESQDLPRLVGPDGQAAEVLNMYGRLKPLFEPLDLSVDEVSLSGRGSWSVGLDTGATIELGRGSAQEVLTRATRFAQTITQAAGRYGRSPEAVVSADLRHEDGYALRLRGVGVNDGETTGKKK